MTEKTGLYIHVPFCAAKKCPYCDFYSLPPTQELKEAYISAVERDIISSAQSMSSRIFDTVYFGGGTPALLGAGLARLLDCARTHFAIEDGAEITFEANPVGIDYETLALLHKAGFNRLSLGMQSAIPRELELLGRAHTPLDTESAVNAARRAGFDNISLDLMLCVPEQTAESMERSVAFMAALSPRHISAYLLKIEPGTRFAANGLMLPDDDAQADMYLKACEAIERHGYKQYEISNFAQSGFESRHNLKYWRCGKYLGLGPAAHSFINGRRFYYGRSLRDYIKGDKPADDGEGGSFEEYVMLRLRLCEGLDEADIKSRFGCGFEAFGNEKIRRLCAGGLIELLSGKLRLTRRGFIVSNSVIAALLYY